MLTRHYITEMQAGEYLYAAGARGYRIPTMIAIGQAESRLDAHAINMNTKSPTAKTYRSLDVGVWQANSYYWVDFKYNIQSLFDPEFNAKVAWEIFTKSGGTNANPKPGLHAWASYTNGYHLPFLGSAQRTWMAMGSP